MCDRDLIERALSEERTEPALGDDGHDWPAATKIGLSERALEVARSLAGAESPVEQAVAAHILSVAVNGKPENVEGALGVLTDMIPKARDLHVEWAISDALRLTWDIRAVEPLLSFSEHSSASVRRNVASGLGGAMCNELHAEGLRTLIRLTRDPVDAVRDWATFELGQSEFDTREVREALWARATDRHFETRSEALSGLAKLGDREVVPLVRVELEARIVGRLAVEAATALADPSLLPALLKLRDWWDVDVDLREEAIRACGG